MCECTLYFAGWLLYDGERKTRTEMEMSTGCIKNYVRFQGKRMY